MGSSFILVIGEAPAKKGSAPFENSRSGERIRSWSSAEGILPAHRFKFVNLFDSPMPKQGKGREFPAREAATRAKGLHLPANTSCIVLAGKRVAAAFGLRSAEYFCCREICGLPAYVMPHPSGVNRWWNDPVNASRARAFFIQLPTIVDATIQAWRTKRPQIVGLMGLAGSGKSTAAKRLLEFLPNAVRVPFAEPLKQLAAEFGLSYDQLYGNAKELHCPAVGMSPRAFMQKLGAGARKVFGPDFWVLEWKRKVKLLGQAHPFVMVDDVRYSNELDAISDMGGFIINVELAISNSGGIMDHESEKLALVGSSVADVTIRNAMDEAFFRTVEATLSVMLKDRTNQ